MSTNRREFIQSLGIASAALAAGPLWAVAAEPAATPAAPAAGGAHTLPPLPYPVTALEPHLDAETMTLHHDKHHKAYVDGLNKAEAELTKARAAGDYALIQHWSRQAAFHGGGHHLHTMFWSVMAPPGKGGGGDPSGPLAMALTRDFGGLEAFRKQFAAAAIAVEGSGWALLHYRPADGKLIVLQAENQQKLSPWGVVPLLGIDVWEHAYYLKYQNRRADYVAAWWNVVDWAQVGRNLDRATRLAAG